MRGKQSRSFGGKSLLHGGRSTTSKTLEQGEDGALAGRAARGVASWMRNKAEAIAGPSATLLFLSPPTPIFCSLSLRRGLFWVVPPPPLAGARSFPGAAVAREEAAAVAVAGGDGSSGGGSEAWVGLREKAADPCSAEAERSSSRLLEG